MSPDPADWLAAAATMSLPSPVAPESRHVLVPATFDRRLLALGLDALVFCVAGLLGAMVITSALWDAFFHVDGPPFDMEDLDNAGACLLLMSWCALGVAYTVPEAFGRGTLGKAAAGLRPVAPGPAARRRLALRWALSYLPLLALSAYCGSLAAWAAWRRAVGPDPTYVPGQAAGGWLLGLFGTTAIFWPLAFLCACETGGRTLAEQISGTKTLCARPPGKTGERRGFEVIRTRGEGGPDGA